MQTQINKSTRALEELNKLNPEERLKAVELLIEKRKKKSFCRYFEPWSEQQDALAKFTSDIKVLGLLGGNRSGKTILGAFIAVAWCLGKGYFKDEPAFKWVESLPIPDHPVNVWIVGLDYSTLRDVIWYEKLRNGKNHPPFLPDDATVVKKVSDGDFQIFFHNGSILTGKSADAGREKFQGASVDLVWIDEECEKDVYDECYQRTIDCAGKLLLTLTPLTDINSGVREPWVYDLYEQWRAGDKDFAFCQLSTLNSPFLPQQEKDRLITKWAGSPEEQARLYGGFVRKSGLVYPQWDDKIHRVKPFSIPDHWARIVSIDPAATGTTAAIWIAADEYGNYYAYREYYEKERTVKEHAVSINILRAGEPVDYWLLDPTWGGQRNAENHKNGAQLYRESGLPVRLPEVGKDFGLNLSRQYIDAAVTAGSRHPFFKIFQDTIPNFEFERSHYTWDTYAHGEMRGQSKEKPRKKHDHLMNAFQYACCIRAKGGRSRGGNFFDKSPADIAKLNSYT